MSDDNKPTAAVEPPAVNVDLTTPPAPAAKAKDDKPEWLDARLEQARKSVLKELGFESLEDGKKIAADAKAAAEAKKSDAQRAADLENSLKSTKAEKEALAEALGGFAKAQLSALTDTQRVAVVAAAGDDPAKQLKVIDALRPTWASASVQPVVAETPKDTAPAPSAPKAAGTNSAPPDKKATYDELVKSNPVIAARYAEVNGLFDLK